MDPAEDSKLIELLLVEEGEPIKSGECAPADETGDR